MHHVGIIPFDMRDDMVAILFVTSQTRGRWILPKGKQKKNETHIATCLREGFEEAGVRGEVFADFPITVVIKKLTEDGLLGQPVTYYPLLVTEQADEWPEREQRQRHWALIDDASRVAYREDYLPLIQHFEILRPWIKETAQQYR